MSTCGWLPPQPAECLLEEGHGFQEEHRFRALTWIGGYAPPTPTSPDLDPVPVPPTPVGELTDAQRILRLERKVKALTTAFGLFTASAAPATKWLDSTMKEIDNG